MASCRVVVESVADDEFAVLVAADDGVAHGAVGAAVVVRRRRRRDGRRLFSGRIGLRQNLSKIDLVTDVLFFYLRHPK